MLRAYQMGLRLDDLETMEYGFVIEMITEIGRDEYKWPQRANQADFDRF